MNHAREEAEQLIEQARASIEQEKKQAMTELKSEVAKLAIQAASKIIDSELDDKKNKKLVDSFLSDLPKN
jgi:F-type H+-transporting ATPase subunit b